MSEPSFVRSTRGSSIADACVLMLVAAFAAAPCWANSCDLRLITEQLLVRNPSYRCNRCGFGARTHHWQCPSCKEWGTSKPLLNYAVV